MALAGRCRGDVLAALAVEHGLPLVSADSDFARFTDLRWTNPFA
jgi:predicted nucleic acid-binding protein